MLSTSGFKIVVDDVADSVRDSILGMDKPVRDACKAAIYTAGNNMLDKGQEDIAKAGFSHTWQSAWHVKFYPQDGHASIDAAVYAYHKIPYASIFETGGTISGRPLLWIPLRNAPRSFGGKGHLTPKRLAASGVRLFSINRAGKPPLLATKIYASQAQSKKLNFNVTAASLRKSRRKPEKPGKKVLMTVPLFIGLSSVTIRKKFHLDKIAQDERDALPEYYVAALKVD